MRRKDGNTVTKTMMRKKMTKNMIRLDDMKMAK